jgi:DNA-binding transcriptional MerR regulator
MMMEMPHPTSAAAEAGLDIAVLAREAGVSPRTIRYYGELNLLHAAGRGAGGRRRFAVDALERLRFIARLKQLGMTLEEIGDLNATFDRGRTPAMLDRLLQMLDARLAQVGERMRDFQRLDSELRAYRGHIETKRNGA